MNHQKHPNHFHRFRYLSAAELNRLTAKRGYEGALFLDPLTAVRFDVLRGFWGRAIVVGSAFRNQKHNAAVGGARYSAHLYGRALDMYCAPHEVDALAEAAKKAGFTGIIKYPWGVHGDDIMPGEFREVPRPQWMDNR